MLWQGCNYCKRSQAFGQNNAKIAASSSSNKAPLALDDTDSEDACLEDDGAHPGDKMISHTGFVGGVPRKANVVAGGKTLSAVLSCADGKLPAPANRVPRMDETDPASLAPVKVPQTRLDLVHQMDRAIMLPTIVSRLDLLLEAFV